MAVRMKKSGAIGKLIIMIGILIAVPLLMIPFYPEDIKYAWAFIVPSVLSIILGLLLCIAVKNDDKETDYRFHVKYASLTVVCTWFYGFLAGAMPFYLAGKLTFVQSLFEAVSGWTTTGLSAMDVTQTEHIFLFHRSFMQYCGGLGFVMMMIMFIQGKEAMNLYNAEGHPDKLMPNIGKTARIICTMYMVFLLSGTILYVIFGMSLFDSINHAMCALSTGGFSTVAESIGYYNSMPIELITILLMLIGTTNFAVLLLGAKKKFRQMAKVSEVRFMFALMVIFIPLMGISISVNLYMSLSDGMRQALFNAVSALSTSGFGTMSYADWPHCAVGIMVILMLIGGGIGSTAGGIKLTRVYIMCRVAAGDFKSRILSKRSVRASYYYTAHGKTEIDEGMVRQAGSYVFTYLGIFAAGSLLLTETADCTLPEAMFEFASSLGTVGLSIGITGPATNDATLIVEMLGMILGRLEIFIVFVGIYSIFIRHKKDKRGKKYESGRITGRRR